MRAATALAVGALSAVGALAGEVGLIDQETLLVRLGQRGDSLIVLDVRTAAEYSAGHVPGAINVPHDQLEARVAEIAPLRSKEVVVYCRSGRRTELALATLATQGFEHLLHLEGDMLAWQAANRPLEMGAKPDAAPAPDPR